MPSRNRVPRKLGASPGTRNQFSRSKCAIPGTRGQFRVRNAVARDIASVTRVEGEWLVLEAQPGSPSHRRLDPYRIELARLGDEIVRLVGL